MQTVFAAVAAGGGQAMKIRVRREPLLKGCRLADRVFPERAVEPGASRLLLQAREDVCALYAVGSEVALRLEIPAVVAEAGEALLPARQALAVVRETAAEELTLESAHGRVRAQGEDAEFFLEAPDISRAPVRLGPSAGAGPASAGVCQQLPADLLALAARRTVFAAGRATSRYSLQAVQWELEPDQVRLAATDNRRLAVAEVPAQTPDEHQAPLRWLLPARAVDLLARLAEGQAEPIQALFGPRHALFRAGPDTLCARYIMGNFPDWRRAIPPRPPHLFLLPVGPFLVGVRQAVALREKEGARLLLRFEPGWVQMQSRQAGAGQSRVRLPLPLAGGRADIALNPLFLVELLRAFDPESTLLLGLTDPQTPALFSDGDSCTHLLMPLGPR
jgi:DNA polymerase-3 subunit beta